MRAETGETTLQIPYPIKSKEKGKHESTPGPGIEPGTATQLILPGLKPQAS